MKNILFFLVLLMPVLVIGQDRPIDGHYKIKNDEVTLHFLSGPINFEPALETALIDDRHRNKSILDFDFNKSHSLSYTLKNKRLYKFSDIQKPGDDAFLEIEPLIEFDPED